MSVLSCFSTLLLFFASVQCIQAGAKESHKRLKRASEPEMYMTVTEIIRYHGYPVQVYEVITSDGYILTIQRIPYGKSGKGTKPRKPVLVQHGLLCSSAAWIVDIPEKNLPYILADQGYDVWLGNVRGTLFGRKHVTLSAKDSKFWTYSFDEMAKYDIPAVIDKMLNVTGFEQIYYIGHSMGTAASFALLSTQPKYNRIIRTNFALAPIAQLQNVRSPIRLFAPLTTRFSFVLNIFGNGEFFENEGIVKLLTSTVCNSPIKSLCSNIIFLLCGYDIEQLNSTRLPVYLAHTPAGTSVQTLTHFSQLVESGKFAKYDYGSTTNKKLYGGETKPPVYDLKKIRTNVALFWSDNDYLADPKDVAWLATQLSRVAVNYRVPFAKFSHMDFLWAIDVKPLLYNKLVQEMARLWAD